MFPPCQSQFLHGSGFQRVKLLRQAEHQNTTVSLPLTDDTLSQQFPHLCLPLGVNLVLSNRITPESFRKATRPTPTGSAKIILKG